MTTMNKYKHRAFYSKELSLCILQEHDDTDPNEHTHTHTLQCNSHPLSKKLFIPICKNASI